MKAAILCLFLVCAMGANIRASMMSEAPNPEMEEYLKTVLTYVDWVMSYDQNQKGGLNEEEIHSVLQAFKDLGWAVTDETLGRHDYVVRFDANNDGLVDRTEVIKFIKWFVRNQYLGSWDGENIAKFFKESYNYHTYSFDQNRDNNFNKDETTKFMTYLAELYEHTKDLAATIDLYFEDYDTNGNKLLDLTELEELYKRHIRDIAIFK